MTELKAAAEAKNVALLEREAGLKEALDAEVMPVEAAAPGPGALPIPVARRPSPVARRPSPVARHPSPVARRPSPVSRPTH